jgi:tetratricopeptide (TPR) repeat protein
VPAGVREVVLRRVARLGPQATQVLGVAAVMGGSFHAAALAPAASLPSEEVAEVLDRAVAARLLAEVDRRGRLTFAHALIRRTLHDELGGVVRAHLHGRIAETLESRRAELRPHPAELAHHFYEARHSLGADAALHHARIAADDAAASLAWEDAATQLERALELDALRDASDPSDRCELLLELGVMRMRAGHPEFSACFAQAAKLARGRSSTQLARAAIGYAGRYYEAGVVDRTLIGLLREALAKLDDGEQPDLRARVLGRLAEILHFAGDPSTALELSAQAVQSAAELADDQVLFDVLMCRHTALLHVSDLEERLVASDELVRMSIEMHDSDRTLQGLQARVFDLIEAGRIEVARECLSGLAEIAAEVRQPLFVHFAVGWAASFAQMEGRLDEAERLAADSAVMRGRMETADAESVFAAQLFLIRIAQGRLRELVEAVEHFVGQYPELAAWRAGLPLAYLAAGREEDGRSELEEIVSELDSLPRDFFWLTTVGLLAEASAKLGHSESAAVLYDTLAPYSGCMVQVGYAGSLGPVSRLLGLLAAARGDREAAVSHLETALAMMEAAGLRLFEAQARDELAQLATRSS